MKQVRADNWQDREDNRRPTPERIIKGAFELRDSEDAGVRFAVDDAACILSQLRRLELITRRQEEAGFIFERIARGRLGSPGQRSCLDWTPKGHEAEDDTDDEIRAMREWRNLCTMMAQDTQRELLRVCWENTYPRDPNRMRLGLDITADWAGLAED